MEFAIISNNVFPNFYTFLCIIIQVRLHYLFKPMNIPCCGFLIILIASNLKTDNAYFSQLQTLITCFCTILSCFCTILSFTVNKLGKKTPNMSLYYLQCTAGMPLRLFWFILCFQFDGNLSHLIGMASLYFTKPCGEDEAKIYNKDLGYTFR